LSFVVGSFAGEEDDELDAATTLVVVLQMQQSRMLVPAYWLAFTDDQVPHAKLVMHL